MKHLKITVALASLLFSTYLFSQNKEESTCSTSYNSELQTYLNRIKPTLKSFEQDLLHNTYSKKSKSSKILHKIPLKIHIIRNSKTSSGLDIYELEQAIENLNNKYANAFMSFYQHEDVNFINKPDYVHLKKGDEKQLQKTDYTPGMINIYFTEAIENSSGSSICGYSVNKDNGHLIVMKNTCTTNNSSLVHEMGHVFSLMHTHGPSNTKMTTELVDGSNCDTDGDGICDTPADPGLSSTKIDNFCTYTGNETDANGASYNPDTENIMSYSRKACRNYFTPQQLARMYAYFNIEKNGFMPSENSVETNEDSAVNNGLNEISIYPNPVSGDYMYLKDFNNLLTVHFQITNLQGQILISGKVTNGEIGVENLSPGTYVLQLITPNSKAIKKFIK